MCSRLALCPRRARVAFAPVLVSLASCVRGRRLSTFPYCSNTRPFITGDKHWGGEMHAKKNRKDVLMERGISLSRAREDMCAKNDHAPTRTTRVRRSQPRSTHLHPEKKTARRAQIGISPAKITSAIISHACRSLFCGKYSACPHRIRIVLGIGATTTLGMQGGPPRNLPRGSGMARACRL